MAIGPERFTRFAAIDWSGAKGKRHKGIAVALCQAGTTAPVLVEQGRPWSREEVLEWLLGQAAEAPTLFGFDFCSAPPIVQRGAYLPGDDVPDDAKKFWAYVDRICEDEDLGAASFLEKHHRRHFYFGISDGAKADFLHHRVCELAFNATGGGKASTLYDAIGASQVAKASFAGMRLLNRLQGKVPVWPFDPLPKRGSVVVEIYTRAFIRLSGLAGRKIRTIEDLNHALAALGSESFPDTRKLDDHQTDVLISAGGMRSIAGEGSYWSPVALTPHIARTEGWTFGVR